MKLSRNYGDTPVIPFVRSRRLRLSPSLGSRHGAIELAADVVAKVWRAVRPSNSFRRKRIELGILRVCVEQIRELAKQSRNDWTLTRASSTPASARALWGCGHSEALATSCARTGLSASSADRTLVKRRLSARFCEPIAIEPIVPRRGDRTVLSLRSGSPKCGYAAVAMMSARVAGMMPRRCRPRRES